MENTEFNADDIANRLLKDARQDWQQAIEGNGGYCPCCARWGKIYRRPINSSMARALLWLVNAPHRGDGWVHVPSTAPIWMLRSHQLPTLHLWGLVMHIRPEPTKLASSGLWQPTELGRAFAANKVTVKRYVYVYNNTALEFEGSEIGISDALGDKYNYAEIMANYNGTPSNWEELDGTNS